ncbi:MAG: response regulator transcription factor [Ignavibacteriales bacterium]|nr:response regulator transcription factor [Ignavibacteriales bacterium]
MPIKAVIVDDEMHAREGIRLRVEKNRAIQVVGECASGRQAVQMIDELKPGLIFLDIQMPEMNGFEVLSELKTQPLPAIIFVTAFDSYALKAFEFHAVDYLLKPVNDEKFAEALNLAVQRINLKQLESYTTKVLSVVSDYNSLKEPGDTAIHEGFSEQKKQYLTRFMIKKRENIFIVSVNDIDWLESEGDYVYIHSGKTKYLLRETLTSLEAKLDPQRFIRIHRSTILNIEKVKQLKATPHGDFDILLANGEMLKMSRTHKAQFQKVIGWTL